MLRNSQTLRQKVIVKRWVWGGEQGAEASSPLSDGLENIWKGLETPRSSFAPSHPPGLASPVVFFVHCPWGSAFQCGGDDRVIDVPTCKQATAGRGLLQNIGLRVHTRSLRSKPRWLLPVCPFPAHTWYMMTYGVHLSDLWGPSVLLPRHLSQTTRVLSLPLT